MPNPTPSMPALPEPNSHCTHADSHEYDVWDAEQMHAYAQAVADARVREALAGLLDEIAEFDHKLTTWPNAYPEDVFPKPDMKAVHEALEAAGISIGCVSAANMRHVAEHLSKEFQAIRSLAGKEIK